MHLIWDVNAAKQLPDYMKICFLGLFNTINEMAYVTLKEHGVHILPYLKNKVPTSFFISYLSKLPYNYLITFKQMLYISLLNPCSILWRKKEKEKEKVLKCFFSLVYEIYFLCQFDSYSSHGINFILKIFKECQLNLIDNFHLKNRMKRDKIVHSFPSKWLKGCHLIKNDLFLFEWVILSFFSIQFLNGCY